MPRVDFQGSSYQADERSVLGCLTAHGHVVPSSCLAGVCQSCLMRVVRGAVPARAQAGLTPAMAARGLFLACQCYPTEDIDVVMANDAIRRFDATVVRNECVGDQIRALGLRPAEPYEYRAGQFLRLFMDATTSRNYSLASVPSPDGELELHVRRFPGGTVSGWIFDHLRCGERVTISEAFGDCFYMAGRPDQDILLIGTSCGLAPLYGIARDALDQGHRGRIHLYHGARSARGLYHEDALRAISDRHPNFQFWRCVSDEPAPPGLLPGSPCEAAIRHHADLCGWRVFLCGNPQMVETARLETFLAGAASAEIHADPFVPTSCIAGR